MSEQLRAVRIGVALVLLCLAFGVAMGISFGVNEDGYKIYIADTIAAHPDVHDASSNDKIWRYAQRAHFHATGISAFSLGLVILVALSGMQAKYKTASSILIGLGGLYPLAWFNMFLQAPSIGRDAAHHHYLTEMFTYIGVGGLLAGLFLLIASLFLGLFGDNSRT